MERVAFLIEKTGQTISCLLNPEGLVQRRRAGVRALRSATAAVTGVGLSDDPLVATGGGTTEYDIDLLFDVDIARDESARGPERTAPDLAQAPGLALDGGSVDEDVRELTRPLWALSENAVYDVARRGAPPAVRMIWGRSWNVLGVVIEVAERLERFNERGVPGRSWLRMRFRRVSEAFSHAPVGDPVTPQFDLPTVDAVSGGDSIFVDAIVGPDGLPNNRLDQVAAEVFGNPGAWSAIASSNGIDNPLDLPQGTVLSIPFIGDGD